MSSLPSVHVPVLMEEVVEWAKLAKLETIVDGTLGGGGHARRLMELLPNHGQLIGLDRDPHAVARTAACFAEWFPESVRRPAYRFFTSSYAMLPDLREEHGLPLADLILLDLGLSSDQLAAADRGFSFRNAGPLDLRFDPESGISAAELIAKLPEKDLADLIYHFGEERFSRRIAKAIVERRRADPVVTSEQLHELIHRVVPGRVHGRVDASTRTFQALRIAVNRELEHLERALARLPECLKPGGRLLIISFHSLEDRMVKNAFRDDPRWIRLTKKPIIASQAESDANPRSRSAKLRVAERSLHGVAADGTPPRGCLAAAEIHSLAVNPGLILGVGHHADGDSKRSRIACRSSSWKRAAAAGSFKSSS